MVLPHFSKMPHVYSDSKVTRERIATFANASTEEQLGTLTELRRRATTNLWEVTGIGFAVLLAFMAITYAAIPREELTKISVAIFGERPTQADGSEIWELALSTIFFPLGLVVSVTLLLLWAMAMQSRAAAWVSAYEDELARRHAASGKKADRWRKAHPIDWD